MLTMNAFYLKLNSPAAKDDSRLNRLLLLSKACLTQLRALKSVVTWDPWETGKA
jgi:hypothetical protein